MSTSTGKLKAKLSALNLSLDELEAELEPLLAQTLPETVVNLAPVQQAKLQVLLPYLVHGLIFVYLKTRGVDPKTHPVVQELERVKQYFDKIKEAEDPAKRTTAIDKDAATRFIKHAISQAVAPQGPAAPSGPTPGSSVQSSARVPVKVTEKMKARAEYTKTLAEDGSDEEEEADLQVIDEDSSSDEPLPAKSRSKGKGKQKPAEPAEPAPTSLGRRKRQVADAFAGYDVPADSPASGEGTTSASPAPEPSSDKEQKKKRKKARKSDVATS